MRVTRTLVAVAAKELLGYDDLTSLPESTGTDKLVLKRGNLFAPKPFIARPAMNQDERVVTLASGDVMKFVRADGQEMRFAR